MPTTHQATTMLTAATACRLGAAAAMLALLAPAALKAQTCQAKSPERQALLVELYTSEGCNSCPPADRWLSSLQGKPSVITAAFHVDYWDRLGWADRFASPHHTQRQAELQRSAGAGFSYTPQLLANGRDWRGAPTLPLLDAKALVQVDLQRVDASQVGVMVTAQRGAPARLALWWALLEDGHVSPVRAGENRGVTLRHDAVVRQYGKLPAWATLVGGAGDTAAAHILRISAPHNAEGGHKARLLVVVTDAATGAPLQAVQLSC